MNTIQTISHNLETSRLKMQLGLNPSVKFDTHTLRAMWRKLKMERLRRLERAGMYYFDETDD